VSLDIQINGSKSVFHKCIVFDFYVRVIKDMQAESPLTSVSFMQDGAAFAVGTTRGKHSVKLCHILMFGI
jgi:hypothetical protein